MQHDLARSLWYLHSQPPAFNAFVGILLHVPGPHAWVFGIVFVAMGLALACTMFALMLELGVPLRFALVVTSLFIVSPTTVLYENWLLYSYPVALMLCGIALCFARFARTQRIRYAVGFGSLLSLLALTRASYHLLFVVGAGAFVLGVCTRAQWRRALVAVMVPISLVLGLYVKNEIQFGQPTSSTWLGMNLAHMMFRNHSNEFRADVAAGRVSAQAAIAPFSPLPRYKNVALPHTGVPALDLVSVNGHPNYNNRAYVTISNRYLKDVAHFVARHPGIYVAQVGDSYRTAFASAADYQAFVHQRPHIAFVVGLQNRLLGQVHDLVPPTPTLATPGADRIAWLVVVQYVAVAVAGAALALRALRRRGPPLGPAQWTFLLLAFTVVYSTIAFNVLELGDNNRYRFETDPLVCVGAAALVAYAFARRRRAQVAVAACPPLDLGAVPPLAAEPRSGLATPVAPGHDVI